MRKGLLLVVVLLVVSSLMAAAAYSSAAITSNQELKVVNTDQALLALIPGTGVGNMDNTASLDNNGVLRIDFGKSSIDKNGFPGLQPGSVYQWDQLLDVWNKSKENLNVTINVDGEVAQYLTIKGKNESGWYQNLAVFDKGTTHTFTLGTDSTIPLTFNVDIPAGAAHGDFNGQIVVSATAK